MSDSAGRGVTNVDSQRIVVRFRRKSGTPKTSGTASPTHAPYRVAEFFGGIGGIRLALKNNTQALISYVYDNVQHCKRIYDANFFMPTMICTDISNITITTIPDFDIMFCGIRSLDDQNINFIQQIIETKTPNVICLETITQHIKDKTSDTTPATTPATTPGNNILNKLKQLGYYTTKTTIDHSQVTTIPHSKIRGYIIATKNIDILTHFTFPHQRTSPLEPITRFFEGEATIHDKYYYQPGKGVYDILDENITKSNALYQFCRYYVRENKSGKCPTLTANMGRGGHNVPLLRDTTGIRKLTPRECLNFQGFPSTFVIPPSMADCHVYSCIGDSLSPPVIKLIADAIMTAMYSASTRAEPISNT